MRLTIDQLRELRKDANVRAFLLMIRRGETSASEDAYRWLFGSTTAKPLLFDDFSKHPNVKTYEKYDGQFIKNDKLDYTTAAGALQITKTTHDGLVKQYGFTDFTPETQDLMAIALIIEKGALEDVLSGRIESAIVKLRSTWVSLPGAKVGDQPSQKLASAIAAYQAAGGSLFGQAARQGLDGPTPVPPAFTTPIRSSVPAGEFIPDLTEETPMPAAAFLLNLLPSLVTAFAPMAREKIEKEVARHTDSPEVQTQVVAGIFDSLKAVTSQADPVMAVAAVKSDPELAQKAQDQIVDDINKWMPLYDRALAIEKELREANEASVEAARQFNKDDEFLIDTKVVRFKFIHLLSVAFVVFSGFFAWDKWDSLGEQFQGAVIMLMIVAGYTGVKEYWLGWSHGSATKQAMLDRTKTTQSTR